MFLFYWQSNGYSFFYQLGYTKLLYLLYEWLLLSEFFFSFHHYEDQHNSSYVMSDVKEIDFPLLHICNKGKQKSMF